MTGHEGGTEDGAERTLYIVRLTAPGDPETVIGYAMAEQIDFVAKRDGLHGAVAEALRAAEQAFAKGAATLDAVALKPHRTGGTKMFAMIGSGDNFA